MASSKERSKILEEEGFIYHFSRMIYINGERRKIFGYEAIEDNSVDWLREKISERSKPDE